MTDNKSISRLETTQTCAVKTWLTYHPDSPASGRERTRWDTMPVQDWGPAEKGQFIHQCLEDCIKMKNIAGVIPIIEKWAAREGVVTDIIVEYVYMFTKAMKGVTTTCAEKGWDYKNVVMSGVWKRSHGDLTQGSLSFWCKPEWTDIIIATLQSVYYLNEQAEIFYTDSGCVEEEIHSDEDEVKGIVDFHDTKSGIICDFKTGYKVWKERQVSSSNQLMMYSLLYHAKTGKWPEKVAIFSVEQGKLVMVPFDLNEYRLFINMRLPQMQVDYNRIMKAPPEIFLGPVAAGLSGSAAFCPCDMAQWCPYV